MTNLDIETFWAVVQHGTMTAAAEALYITQPTPVSYTHLTLPTT